MKGKLFVESDGDRVPKDVYICESGRHDRVCTMDGTSETTMFASAREIVKAVNDARLTSTAELDNARPISLLEDAVFQLERLSGDNLEAYARTFAALAKVAIAKAKGTP